MELFFPLVPTTTIFKKYIIYLNNEYNIIQMRYILFIVTFIISTVLADTSLTGLHVAGNKILNINNEVVQLRVNSLLFLFYFILLLVMQFLIVLIFIKGVNRPGTEYSCIQYNRIFDGPIDQASINAMKVFSSPLSSSLHYFYHFTNFLFQSWKINSVRVPINEDCWLGTGGVNPSVSGDNYLTPVVNYVKSLTGN